MKRFDILPKGDAAARIRAIGSTRAGVLTAAVQGMFAAVGAAVNSESDEKSERPFSVMADDAPTLLAELLTEALAASARHGEAFDDVRFTLVTDKKAEGAFIGRACRKYAVKLAAVERTGLAMEKNEEGEWISENRFPILRPTGSGETNRILTQEKKDAVASF